MRAAGFVVAGVVVVAGVAVALSLKARQAQMDAARDAQAQAAAAREDAEHAAKRIESEVANERRRAQHAEKEVAELRAELEAVRAALAEATAPPPEDATDSAEAADAGVPAFPAYTPEGLGDALATVDWDVVADSMSHMPPLIAELAEHLAEGRPMNELPAETIGSIQRYNGPLVTTAMRLSQKGVAGTDVNGAFSHPGFMSNALAATLAELEMPLTSEQSARLDRITADYSAREAKRADGYGEDAYALEKIVDESKLKHAYFAEVYAVLTPAQHDAVRPEAVRGRTQLDIFCESLVWAGKAGPMVFTDRADLTSKVGSWATSRGRIPEGLHEQARALVAQWVDELPEEALRWEPDGLARSGMLHVENVTTSAGHVLRLLKTFDRELDLDARVRASLRAVPGSIVLYHDTASGE